MKLWIAAACAVPAAVLGATATLPDRPPLAHTGGFGEPTCVECHSESSVNQPGGSVAVEGVPWRYEPNGIYRITIRLVREGLQNGGFELSARIAAGTRPGTQAGTLRQLDDRVDVTDSTFARYGPISYARHTRAGSIAVSDTIRWTLEWRAPGVAAGTVIFNVAANAGNDDNSPLGDYIYTSGITSRNEEMR